jgi:hypothetical protein
MSDRLLTDEQIKAIQINIAEEFDIDDDLLDYLGVDYERYFVEAQDARTRKLTLKEVGEWLEKALGFDEMPNSVIGKIEQEHIEALKRGEMPE